MRHIPFSPDLDWTGCLRWLCRVRLTCDDVTRRFGIPFIEDDGLPHKFGALVEIDGLRFLLEAVPQARPPMTWIVVSPDGNVRSPRQALDIVLPALGCTADDVEALYDDLSEWPWMLTRDDGQGGRKLERYERGEESATASARWLQQRHPERDYRAEPATQTRSDNRTR
jgi:hypothetical protein